MHPPMSPRSRRRALVAVGLLAAVGVGIWYVRRPEPPRPPAVDLSRADPDVAAAVRSALDAVERRPGDATAWGRLGMVLRAHDFEPECLDAFRHAEQLDPADARWPYLQGLTLLLARPDDGLGCLERAAARTGRPEPKLRLAETLLARGRLDDADGLARQAPPDEPRTAVALARLADARGQWDAVLRHTEPVRDDPRCRKQVALLRGQALARLGQSAESEAELKRVADLPDDPAWDDPFVRQVEELQVGQAADLRGAGELMARGAYREAIPRLERAVNRDPGADRPRLQLGRALLLAGEPAAARSVLEELTRRHPDSVDGWYHLGLAHLDLGDPAAAAVALARAVKLKPDHALGHYQLGVARHRQGDRAGAVAALEEALRCRPDYEPASRLLREVRGK